MQFIARPFRYSTIDWALRTSRTESNLKIVICAFVFVRILYILGRSWASKMFLNLSGWDRFQFENLNEDL